MSFTDNKGHTWTRSADRKTLTRDDGLMVQGNPEMTDAHLASVAYEEPPIVKTDAERIAELEAQVAALLAKLS